MQKRIHKTIHNLRQKPQHVRERILLVTIAVITPVLFTVWFATFRFKSNITNTSFKDVSGAITKSYNNPIYNTDLILPASLTPASPETTPTPTSTDVQTPAADSSGDTQSAVPDAAADQSQTPETPVTQ